MARTLVNVMDQNDRKNWFHNSACLFDQRGIPAAQVSIDSAHRAVDRWFYRFSAGAGTMTFRSRKNNGSPNNKTFYCITAESTAGSATGVTQNCLRHVWEKSESRKILTLANGQFSVGFWYLSTVTGTHCAQATFGAGSFTAVTSSQAVTFNYPVASTWQYVTVTFNLPITGNGVDAENVGALFIDIGPKTSVGSGVTTWASGNNFTITQMMCNPGPIVYPWRMCGNNEAEELAICQRYYEKSFDQGTTEASPTNTGSFRENASSVGVCRSSCRFKVTKRTTPNINVYSVNATTPQRIYMAGVNQVAGITTNGETGFTVEAAGGVNADCLYQFTAECEL